MAKKKRKATRPTKARKRRPAAKPQLPPFSFDPTPYLIAARQREFPAAVQSPIGESSPPVPLRAAATMAGESGLIADAVVIPAPVPVTPTVYPDSPGGTLIVHGNVTINFQSAEFKTFNVTMDALVKQMQVGRSNEISGDVCAQLLSEMTAGREILKGPKPSRDLIELLLVKPLKWLAEKAAGAAIGKLAGLALEALLKVIM